MPTSGMPSSSPRSLNWQRAQAVADSPGKGQKKPGASFLRKFYACVELSQKNNFKTPFWFAFCSFPPPSSPSKDNVENFPFLALAFTEANQVTTCAAKLGQPAGQLPAVRHADWSTGQWGQRWGRSLESDWNVHPWYCWWTKSCTTWLDVVSLSHYFWGFIHPRCCRISSTNCMALGQTIWGPKVA